MTEIRRGGPCPWVREAGYNVRCELFEDRLFRLKTFGVAIMNAIAEACRRSPVTDASGLAVLDFGPLGVGDRREIGQLLEGADEAGQHPRP